MNGVTYLSIDAWTAKSVTAIGEQVKAAEKARELHEQDLRRQQVLAHDRCDTCNYNPTCIFNMQQHSTVVYVFVVLIQSAEIPVQECSDCT